MLLGSARNRKGQAAPTGVLKPPTTATTTSRKRPLGPQTRVGKDRSPRSCRGGSWTRCCRPFMVSTSSWWNSCMTSSSRPASFSPLQKANVSSVREGEAQRWGVLHRQPHRRFHPHGGAKNCQEDTALRVSSVPHNHMRKSSGSALHFLQEDAQRSAKVKPAADRSPAQTHRGKAPPPP